MKCRHCSILLKDNFVDLGFSPPSNNYLTKDQLLKPEIYLPLKIMACHSCNLVQTVDFSKPEQLFNEEYAYFSSVSSSWIAHSQHLVESVMRRFNINSESLVLEVAANDGYLLQFFQQLNIPCYGIEPTKSTAKAAKDKGLIIIEKFFNTKLAQELVDEGKKVNLTIANNVLAHVPDINDFLSGFALILKDNGVACFEFPHLLKLMKYNQFDTIYHEHYSYLSLLALTKIANSVGLEIFDVIEVETHGGSLRVFMQKMGVGTHSVSDKVRLIIEEELEFQVDSQEIHTVFQQNVINIKNQFLEFLLEQKKKQKSVIGYGAAAKGSTLLNYSGVRSDLLSCIVDKSTSKQGKYMPGSHIPIVDEEVIRRIKPDYIVIFPWNIKDEVIKQLSYVKEWGCKFCTFIPELTIHNGMIND